MNASQKLLAVLSAAREVVRAVKEYSPDGKDYWQALERLRKAIEVWDDA